jgi:hypothetical protein
MRTPLLLAGGLALLLLGCSGGGSHPPPPLNKQLLAGKWKNSSEEEFIAGYEFAADGTMKLTLRGREQPLPGRYTWSGERTVDLEYPEAADARQAYQAAAKAYKDQVRENFKGKKAPGEALPSALAAVGDELPARETVRVAISERPRLLILTSESGTSRTFEPGE